MRKKPSRHRLRKLSLESLEGRRLLAQMVASPSSQTVDVNDTFSVSTNYSTLPAEMTTGVSLRLHYNADLVSFDVGDITLGVGVPPTQGSPFIGDDTTEDGDNDPTTNMFVQVDFVDFNGTFPTELSPLFDAMFKATAAGSANFNYSFRNAVGETSSTPATVTIEAALAGQIAMASPASQSVAVNDTFTVTTDYSTIPAIPTTGVSLRLHYNTDLVSFDAGDITLGAGVPPTQGSPFIGDDTTEDGDNDLTTNMFVQVDFVDFNGTFPAELSPLFDAMFTATAVGTSNFNYSFRNATGATSSTPATVTINAAVPTVSVAVSPSSVAEDGSVVLTYTFTRSGDASEALSVSYTLGGTATEGTDFPTQSGTVTIDANQTTGTVTIDPTDDTDVEADETIILTITDGANYNVGTPSSATGMIINDDVVVPDPTVSVAVSPASVNEDGSGALTYTFTRSGDASEALSVSYTLGGTATEGTDFPTQSGTVTIDANQTTGTVTIDPTDDTDVEADETIILTITDGANYNVGTPSSATGMIINDDVVVPDPTVSVAVSPASVNEDGSGALTYTFTRSGDASEALSVSYTLGGTATEGTDFPTQSGTVTIDANQTTGTVTIDPTDDTDVEADETIILTITDGANYNVGTPSSATGMIINDDVVVPDPTVSVAVSPASVNEDGSGALTYTFTRSGDASEALSVSYTLGGTATEGTDFPTQSGTVTIDANQTTGTVTIDPTDDTDVEADETIILTITDGANYNVGTPSSATGTIINDDEPPLPTVSVSVNPSSVLEDGTNNLTYTFTRTGGDTTQPLTVNYSTGGSATAGTDYTGTSSSVVILANQTQATVIVDPTADTDDEPDETVILTISPNSGVYNVGTPSATGTIIDNEIPIPGNASLSGFVRDGNERGIPGVFIELTGSALGQTMLVALTADDGSYAFVDLPAGNYKITENQPPAFVDGDESLGSQGGFPSDDMFEIVDLLANDEGRNYNFGELRLVPGQLSKRYFLASTNFATLYRNANANLTELAGNPQDADLIRNSGIPSVVSGKSANRQASQAPASVSGNLEIMQVSQEPAVISGNPEITQASQAPASVSGNPEITQASQDPTKVSGNPENTQANQEPTIVLIPDQQATVGQQLRVAVVASDPNNEQLQFTLDPDNSPATAEIVPSNNAAEIRWTPTALDLGQSGSLRVIATDPGQSSDSEDFMVTVTETIATVNKPAPAAEAELITPEPTSISLPTAEEPHETNEDSENSSLDQTLSESGLH